MLAFDDAAFARIIRGAKAVPRKNRRRWLRDVAEKLDLLTDKRSRRRENVKHYVRGFRDRQKRGVEIYTIEVDSFTFEMMEKFVGLKPNQKDDRQAVEHALGKLLRLGLFALINKCKLITPNGSAEAYTAAHGQTNQPAPKQ
jgi:hypothetical protein